MNNEVKRFAVTHTKGESVTWAKNEKEATAKAEKHGLGVLFVLPSEKSMLEDHARLISTTTKETQ